MPWYAWVMLVLLVVLAVTVVVLIIVNRRRTPEDIKKELEKSKKAEAEAIAKLDKEQAARKKAEKERAEQELALLEALHKKEMEKLTEKEKEAYEEAKKDPQSGIDFMRDFLGGDTGPGEG